VGAVLGILISALGRMILGYPLTLVPMDALLWQVVPGAIVGLLVGAIWPYPIAKVFASFGMGDGAT